MGGFAARWVGFLLKDRPTVVCGSAAYLVGVPMFGVGADRLNAGAELLNPGFHPRYRGWGWYWTGMALDLAGTAILVNGIGRYNSADSEDEREDARRSLGQGLLFGIAGGLCEIAAWVKFMRLADEGRAAGRAAAAAWDVAPAFFAARNGGTLPGAAFRYRF